MPQNNSSSIRFLRSFSFLFLLCCFFFLPGLNSLPVMDRDEARYVQASKQMMETNDYINIKYQEVPRHKKPAGIYWLQSASVSLFSDHTSKSPWPYRLPSALGAFIAVLATFFIGKQYFGKHPAALASGMMAASLLLIAEAHLAKTDAVLLACVTLAQLILGLFYCIHNRAHRAMSPENTEKLSHPRLLAAGFWAALAAGVMVKGPLILVICGLTVLALRLADKRAAWLKQLRFWWGVPFFLLLVVPWFYAVSAATDGAFMQEAVGKDFLPKLFGGQESHGAPPGYYLLVSLIAFWPASLFLWPGLFYGIKERSYFSKRFCLAWIIPSWILFELVPTKLPHYILPLLPPMALLAGTMLYSMASGAGEILHSKTVRFYAFFWGVLSLALGGALLYAAPHLDLPLTPLRAWPGMMLILTATWALYFLFVRKHFVRTAYLCIIGSLLTFPPAFMGLVPSLSPLWVSRNVMAQIESVPALKDAPLAVAGYHEPSLVFLSETKTKLVKGDEAALFLKETPGGLALIEEKQAGAFYETAQKLNLSPEAIATIEGLNYSRGKPVSLSIFKAP